MKTEAQNSPQRRHRCDLIVPLRAAMRTTAGEDGTLTSRPMAALAPLALDGDAALWFFTGLRSSKLENLGSLTLSFSDADRVTLVSLAGTPIAMGEHAPLWDLSPTADPCASS